MLKYWRFSQDRNADSCIVVTDDGIKTISSELTPSKALFRIVVTVSGNPKNFTPHAGGRMINSVCWILKSPWFIIIKLGLEFSTDLNEEHPLKTPTSNDSSLEADVIMNVTNFLQFWKAYLPIILIGEGISNEEKAVPEKEYGSIR